VRAALQHWFDNDVGPCEGREIAVIAVYGATFNGPRDILLV
jgi:hypothetical protein